MATGVVWGRLELLDQMPPYHVGSNMAHEVDFEHSSFEHGALKFQAGTPDVAGPVGLAAAIDFLSAAGAESAWRRDQELVCHGLARLSAIKGLRLLGPRTAEQRVPVFTFVMNGQSPTAVAKALNERGIAIRAGDMAALPLLRRFGVTEAARASAYLYSTTDDIDRLADGLAAIV
jgi:cysteine desulfurase / selenocysteine lyase